MSETDSSHNRDQKISELVLAFAKKCRVKPPQNAVLEACKTVSVLFVFEVEMILKNLSEKTDNFPSLLTWDRLVRERKLIRKQPSQTNYVAPGWVSRKAKGTPAHWEFLFLMVEKGNIEDARSALDIKLATNKMTEDDFFRSYEAWARGEVDPILLRNKGEKNNEQI